MNGVVDGDQSSNNKITFSFCVVPPLITMRITVLCYLKNRVGIVMYKANNYMP